jgi:uncharacterized membrane protein
MFLFGALSTAIIFIVIVTVFFFIRMGWIKEDIDTRRNMADVMRSRAEGPKK